MAQLFVTHQCAKVCEAVTCLPSLNKVDYYYYYFAKFMHTFSCSVPARGRHRKYFSYLTLQIRFSREQMEIIKKPHTLC